MYTIKEASSRSGVGIPLLRAWERRYGVVSPTRSASGYRLYDATAIERLRAMRRLIRSGWSAQQAAAQVRATADARLPDLAGDVEAPTRAEPGETASAADNATAIVERLVDGARRIDTRTIEAALDEAFASARFEVATDAMVMPALRAIGTAWERSEVSVAGEHAASHAVLRRLAMAFEAAGEAGADHPVLVGLGPGSHHELGALAFAVAARRAGMPVLYLGPNLPPESWVMAAETRSASAAVLGAPTRADARRAGEVLLALRTARPGMVLAVGGDGAARVPRGIDVIELEAGSIADAVATVRAALPARA